ncbi:ROK family protein [Curtobacterium luteum]|uniref:ROK family protein n=1 Tax=Curtobacterium luteum TaxID=33881 RepID=UPI00381D2836
MTDSTTQSPSLALAVDLGGTKVEAALVTDQGVVLPGTRHRSPTGPGRTSDELQAAVDEVVTATLATLPADATFIGVGIGSAGPVDEVNGLVSPLNMPVWRGYPLRDRVAQHVPAGVPVTLRMDGLAITLAEHWVGAAQGYDHVMGMIVSTGVGGGLILHGRTVSGPTGNAGHIGHVECGGFDDECACGGTGCLEAVASGPKTVAWAQRQGFAGTTGEELAAAYAAGDEVAVAAVQRSGRALGQAIAAATSLVDLEVVAIGGGFSHVSPDLFEYARQAVAERDEFPFVTKVRIVPTGLSQDGPLIGAAALVHRADVLR